MEIRTAAVLGLGLIGGSVARDLAALGVRVLGYDRDPCAVAAAREDGVLAGELPPDLRGIGEADVIVLAAPVSATPPLLGRVARHAVRARLITDVGSTKASTVAAAEAVGVGSRFVGSHPLAGDHRSGWVASRTGLFGGARVFLCPAQRAGAEAVALAEQLWAVLGAQTETLPADEHDRRLAWTSHLPQIVATALAVTLGETGIARADLGSGGRDTTRLSGSDPTMWTDIALDNGDALADALDAMQARIEAARAGVRSRDAAEIHAFFRAGRAWFYDGQT